MNQVAGARFDSPTRPKKPPPDLPLPAEHVTGGLGDSTVLTWEMMSKDRAG